MLWALPSSWPGRHFSAVFAFTVTQQPPVAVTVTLTLSDLLTAPPVELNPEQATEFRQLMERATALLGARAAPRAARYAFRVEERCTDHLFAVTFTTSGDDEQRQVIVEARHADELGLLLRGAVTLLAAAAAHFPPLSPPPM